MNLTTNDHPTNDLGKLHRLWAQHFPKFRVPDEAQFRRWLTIHGDNFPAFAFAFRSAVKRMRREKRAMNFQHLLAYLSAQMNHFESRGESLVAGVTRLPVDYRHLDARASELLDARIKKQAAKHATRFPLPENCFAKPDSASPEQTEQPLAA